MQNVSLKLPDLLYEKIDVAAHEKHTTKSEVIREALDYYFSKGSHAKHPPSFYDLTKRYCGCIKNAPKDLSHNKEHLDGYGE